MTLTHATFTLERDYPVAPERVFAQWSDPAAKAGWFAGGDAEHELDFRVGGAETARGRHEGTVFTFASTYRDIVADGRIVYSSTLHAGETLCTVSQTTVEFVATAAGTRLVLTEQGAFLDGHEQPSWRERGTADQLDALGARLVDPPAGGE
jgi:uncharacterized protein YndB with AHSA1/START domain